MKKVTARLHYMKIELGDNIGEPITILCHSSKTTKHWSGMAKIHLRNPCRDGTALLQGTRPFIINLDDNQPTLAKVAKSYDSIAPSALLSVKFQSDNLIGVEAHQILQTVVEESFERGHEFEITHVQKKSAESFGWLLPPSPEQADKITKHKVPIFGELLQPVISSGEPLSEVDIARRNCLVLIAKNISLSRTTEQIEASFREYFGTKNLTNIFFPRAKGHIHCGIANLECLNPAVYKQHLRKSMRMHSKHITFLPHPRSLDGSSKPDEETLRRLGFLDVNTAIANTLEAISNAPPPAKKPLSKAEIHELVTDAVTKGISKLKTELKGDMHNLETRLKDHAQAYTDRMSFELRNTLTNLERALDLSMKVVKSIVKPAITEATPESEQPN
jgi:hypothetical protein